MTRQEWADAVHERLAAQCDTTISFHSGVAEVVARTVKREAVFSMVLPEGDDAAMNAAVDQAVAGIQRGLA